MDKARVAETLLAVMAGRRRASEIAGDLLEQHGERPLRFAWAVFAVLVSLSWRWAAGFFLAGVSGMFFVQRYITQFFFRNGFPVQQTAWRTWGLAFLVAGLCLWTATVLNLVRYGLRDRVNTVGLGLSGLLGGIACLMWLPWMRLAGPALMLIALATCLLRRSLRASTLCLLSAASAYAATYYLFFMLMTFWVAHAHGIIAIELINLLQSMTGFAVEGWMLARTRRWLAPTRRLA